MISGMAALLWPRVYAVAGCTFRSMAILEIKSNAFNIQGCVTDNYIRADYLIMKIPPIVLIFE